MKVRIFDTTLRDGEQTPGVSLSPEKKLNIAKKLDALGIDAIETGFPVISEGERNAVKMITSENLQSSLSFILVPLLLFLIVNIFFNIKSQKI